MVINSHNILWVAPVQELGKPYLDLYLDKDHNSLLLFVRISDVSEPTARYAVIPVSPEQMEDYVNSNRLSADVFVNHPVGFASIKEKRITFDDVEIPGEKVDVFRYNRPFDPNLCDNKSRLRMVIKRMMQNKF